MLQRFLDKLDEEQRLMEALKTHILPAVLGDCRLPDGRQLYR